MACERWKEEEEGTHALIKEFPNLSVEFPHLLRESVR
jgi:hypothetical protein